MTNEEYVKHFGKHMVVRIFGDGHIMVTDYQGKEVTPEPVQPCESLPGPINTYHQGLWYAGSPICFWHGGHRYCIDRG